MRCPRSPILALLAFLSLGPPSLDAQVCSPERTALVLSGGGVKGLAHIGMIRVLDSLGVVPDLVVGTSMGAIIGALYASGYSGRELDSLVRAADLRQVFQTYDLHGPQRLRGLSPLVIWEQGAGGVEVQNAAVSEAAVNFLLNLAMVRGNLMARGNFDSLPVPFRAVATNLVTREPAIFAHGDLAQVVRASMAVPVVFEPVEIDGAFFIDGGLSQNVPIAAARQAGSTTCSPRTSIPYPATSMSRPTWRRCGHSISIAVPWRWYSSKDTGWRTRRLAAWLASWQVAPPRPAGSRPSSVPLVPAPGLPTKLLGRRRYSDWNRGNHSIW